MITVGTLFSGIGVPDLAASLLGMDVRFQVEIEDFPTKVLEKHAATYWPHVRRFRDVCDCTGTELGYVDILIGGFPCQDVSTAGKRAGMVEGTRSNLWVEFARLIAEIRPRVVVAENVPGILSGTPYKTPAAPVHQHPNIAFLRRNARTAPGALKVFGKLSEMGYRIVSGCISAEDFGAQHRRERVWFVACATEPGLPLRAGEACVSGTEEPERHGEVGHANRLSSEGFRPVWQQVVGARHGARQPESAGDGAGKRWAAQSLLGGHADGFAAGLVRPVARPGEAQFDYEPPRVVPTSTPNRANGVRAVGNAWDFRNAYALLSEIKLLLEEVTL